MIAHDRVEQNQARKMNHQETVEEALRKDNPKTVEQAQFKKKRVCGCLFQHRVLENRVCAGVARGVKKEFE